MTTGDTVFLVYREDLKGKVRGLLVGVASTKDEAFDMAFTDARGLTRNDPDAAITVIRHEVSAEGDGARTFSFVWIYVACEVGVTYTTA